MTDYPLLVLGSYETYQLAHIATYIAQRIAQHRAAPAGRKGRPERLAAVRDLTGAATALRNATGTSITDRDLPRPLDRETYDAARELVTTGPRRAEVVALAGAGRSGFAVLGHVPGIGAVGAHAPTAEVTDALRTHFLTRPIAELAVWAVTADTRPLPTLPQRVDLAAFVEHLDPAGPDDRAVARNLRGQDRRVDAAIRGRFAGVDLDTPPVTTPASGPGAAPGVAARAAAAPAGPVGHQPDRALPAQHPSGRRPPARRVRIGPRARSTGRSGARAAAPESAPRPQLRSEAPIRLRQPGAPPAAAATRAPITNAGP